MSVRDIKIYYDEISDQYHEMMDNLRYLEEELKKNVVEPERVDQLKKIIIPLKDNYERWSYMMFLLNKPNKKSKQKRYEQQNKSKLAGLAKDNSVEKTIEQNTTVINNIKNALDTKGEN